MRAALATLASVLGAACAPAPLLVEIPFEAADESAVIAVVGPAGTDVWAVDDGVRSMQPLLQSVEGWDREARFEIHAAFYTEGLADLGLAPGRVRSVGSEGRPLPEAARTLSTELSEAPPVRWSPPSSRPLALQRVRIPRRDTPCQRYAADATRTPFGVDTRILALFRGPEGAPWIARVTQPDDGLTLERIDDAGQVDAVETPSLGDDFRVRAAAVGLDGEVWLAGGRFGDHMAVYAGPPRGPFRAVLQQERRLSQSWPRVLAVAREGEGEDTAYFVNSQGVLHRIADGAAVELGALPEPDPLLSNRTALTWHAPGRLYGATPGGDALFAVVDGEIVAEPDTVTFEFATDPIESVVSVPGFGVFAGLDSGFLLERGDDGWGILAENQLVGSSIESIVGFGGGMLVAGRYGIVDQYYRDTEYCVPERVFLGSSTVERVLPLLGGILVAGTGPEVDGPDPWFVTWLRPTTDGD